MALYRRLSSKRHVYLLALMTAFNLALALPALRPGLLADNDFVCHYEYARIFADRFWPETHSLFGFRLEHNLGTPFLLFNPPPLLYWAAAVLSGLGLGISVALKGLLIVGFLAVPLLSYWLARTLSPKASAFPLCAAAVASLFSSELCGLDFFFRNGMANAAVAVPVFLFGLISFRRSMQSTAAELFAWTLAGALSIFVLELVHLQTAYGLVLLVVAQALVEPKRRWGVVVFPVLGALAIASGLAAFWLVPSRPFAGLEPAAYVWIRPYWHTLQDWLLGPIFSSYTAGFSPRYFGRSAVGLCVSVLAIIGITNAVRNRNRPLLAVAVSALIALWLALGPRFAVVLSGIPLYDRLLWYRFLTFGILCWQLIAGWGAWVLLRWLRDATTIRKSLRLTTGLLCGAWILWAISVLVGRSMRITTESDFPQAREDLIRVADYLRNRTGPRGRLYAEFPKRSLQERVSVNYARHLLPLLTGISEVMSWSYENSQIGQALLRRGLLHDNPTAILELQRRLDIQFLTAETRLFRETLSQDPRWNAVVELPTIALFEKRDYLPSAVEDVDTGKTGTVGPSGLSSGGLALTIAPPETSERRQRLLVKYGFSSAWRVVESGISIAPSDDGLIELRLDSAQAGRVIHLVWDISAERRLGYAISAGTLLIVGLLVWRRRWFIRVSSKLAPLASSAGIVICVVAIAVASFRALAARSDDIHFGIRGGMVVSPGPEEIAVGNPGDLSNGGANFLLPGGWGRPEAAGDTAFRRGQNARVAIVVPARGDATVLVDGMTIGQESSLLLRVSDVNGRDLCDLRGLLGQPVLLPADCTAKAFATGDVPGVRLFIELQADAPIDVKRIHVKSDIVYVEGESLLNDLKDGEGDAIYWQGVPGCTDAHGLWLVFPVASVGQRVRVTKSISLRRPGLYALWIRALAEHGPSHFRARAKGFVDGREVGRSECVEVHGSYSTKCPYEPTWIRLGTFEAADEIQLGVEAESVQDLGSYLDLDMVALEPLSP